MMRANYRRGGWYALPAVMLAVVIAVALSAPIAALVSIGAFGFGAVVALLLLGDKREKIVI